MNPPLAYAIDFGTTNSLIAAASASAVWEPVAVDEAASDPTVLRSVLFFPESSVEISCGGAALAACVDSGMRGRLIRSIKRFLPAQSFSETRIGTRRYRLEELVAIVLRTLRERANRALGVDVRAVVLGCPARFSDDAAEDSLARQRLKTAAELAGFNQVVLCEEPVAAALECADRIEGSELVAVADLGGGTSDFTVARLGKGGTDVLAVGGVAVAGDALDGALMRAHVAPHFGSRVAYRLPFSENVLTFPKPLLEKMCSPADLSLLDRRDVLEFLRTIKSFALNSEDRERMDRLLCLVEDRLGFQVFEALDLTKRALSSSDQAEFRFSYPGIELAEKISRAEFVGAAEGQVARIAQRFEDTLSRAGVTRAELDRIYFTGGTAQVPHVTAAIAGAMDPARIRRSSTFHAVIRGLAERARSLVQSGELG